jgi:hypothetical protein
MGSEAQEPYTEKDLLASILNRKVQEALSVATLVHTPVKHIDGDATNEFMQEHDLYLDTKITNQYKSFKPPFSKEIILCNIRVLNTLAYLCAEF